MDSLFHLFHLFLTSEIDAINATLKLYHTSLAIASGFLRKPQDFAYFPYFARSDAHDALDVRAHRGGARVDFGHVPADDRQVELDLRLGARGAHDGGAARCV